MCGSDGCAGSEKYGGHCDAMAYCIDLWWHPMFEVNDFLMLRNFHRIGYWISSALRYSTEWAWYSQTCARNDTRVPTNTLHLLPAPIGSFAFSRVFATSEDHNGNDDNMPFIMQIIWRWLCSAEKENVPIKRYSSRFSPFLSARIVVENMKRNSKYVCCSGWN